jgi:hypothetical protein
LRDSTIVAARAFASSATASEDGRFGPILSEQGRDRRLADSERTVDPDDHREIIAEADPDRSGT